MTTLTKYSPIDSADSLFNRLGRELFPAFDRVLRPVNGEWTANRLPITNINETDDSYILTLEMPGLTRKDVTVSIEGDALNVSGNRSHQLKEKGLLHNEIRSNCFERSFSLMPGVDRENIKATMKDGLLTILLAKAPEKVGRKIDVE